MHPMRARIMSSSFHLFLLSLFLPMAILVFSGRVSADPQTNLLLTACSPYNATDSHNFLADLNSTLTYLRANLYSSSSTSFAIVHEPLNALFQCRNYLSTVDCRDCFNTAVSQIIGKCLVANGARIIYDGCFLRYESIGFFEQSTVPGNTAYCGNKTTPATRAKFVKEARGLLTDLVAVTPRIDRYFAAAQRGDAYAVAQCTMTTSTAGCRQCLIVAYQNIDPCLAWCQDGRAVDAGCFLRYSDEAFFKDNQTTDLHAYLHSGGSVEKRAIIGRVVGATALLLLFISFFAFFWRAKRQSTTHKGNLVGATELRGPVSFCYEGLKLATENFSEQNKLGEGGFGGVYKGVLNDGKLVAVKKLAIGLDNRVRANFESEVKLISNVHHRNLIRLLGCCSRGPELLLVFEYMANKSLNQYIYGDKSGSLDWKQRFNIIVGVARGLSYLHEEFHVCIIHRDIKSSNILLDDNFQPKIADFGLAKLLPGDRSHLTTNFAGTLGYTAPEYALHGQLSEKVDAYSFGIVVLEIVSGRKSNDIRLESVSQYLLEWAWKLYESNKMMDFVDEKLDRSEYEENEMARVIEVALLCTQSAVSLRPAMSEVVIMLLSKGHAMPTPIRPTFIDTTEFDTSSYAMISTNSHGDVSTSQLSARP